MNDAIGIYGCISEVKHSPPYNEDAIWYWNGNGAYWRIGSLVLDSLHFKLAIFINRGAVFINEVQWKPKFRTIQTVFLCSILVLSYCPWLQFRLFTCVLSCSTSYWASLQASLFSLGAILISRSLTLWSLLSLSLSLHSLSISLTGTLSLSQNLTLSLSLSPSGLSIAIQIVFL